MKIPKWNLNYENIKKNTCVKKIIKKNIQFKQIIKIWK